MIRTLLSEHQLQLDAADDFGSTPLHWAALNGR
jgi:ankyrin repeat protein